MKTKVKSVNELYEDKGLYISLDMFSPPSERLPHVIRFELTKGCSWGGCTYCGGYDGVRHTIKDINKYKEHVDKIWDKIGENSDLAKNLRRIFIGGGNALEVETEKLSEAIEYTADTFYSNAGKLPSRVSIYGRTKDIINQGRIGLTKLNRITFHGLDLIYWGVETGSSDVLNYVNKGCTKEQIVEAAEILKHTPITTSIMIMPGLGGIKFYHQHIRDTADVLGKINPRFLTFMGVNPALNSKYSKNMKQQEKEGTNRPLTDRELAEQMIEIIERIPEFRTKIGCYSCEVDGVGYNPLTFGSFNISSRGDKDYLTKELRNRAKRLN